MIYFILCLGFSFFSFSFSFLFVARFAATVGSPSHLEGKGEWRDNQWVAIHNFTTRYLEIQHTGTSNTLTKRAEHCGFCAPSEFISLYNNKHQIKFQMNQQVKNTYNKIIARLA